MSATTTDVTTNGKSVQVKATRTNCNIMSDLHDVEITSLKDVNLTSTDNNINLEAKRCINFTTTEKSINLDAPSGKINLTSSDDIKLKSVNGSLIISSDRDELNLNSQTDSNMISQWGDITIDAIHGTVNIKSQKNINITPGPYGSVNVNGNINAVSVSQGPIDTSNDGSKKSFDTSTTIGLLVPTGCVMSYCGNSAPVGWFLCNGATYDKIIYNTLFQAIGYTFGGSGSSFAVPDMRGRVIVGSSFGVSGISNKNIGDTSGSETHTLTIEEIPPHTHSTTNDGTTNNSTLGATEVSSFDALVYSGGSSTGSAGGGQAHSIMQPYMTLNYIIKY